MPTDLKNVKVQLGAGVILPTQEAEIRKISVGSQPRQIVRETLSQKNQSQKKGWWSGSRYRSCVQTPVLKKNKSKVPWLLSGSSF
jgi:hypothetical protein